MFILKKMIYLKQQRGDGSPDKVKEPFLTVRENGREVYITFNDPRIAKGL